MTETTYDIRFERLTEAMGKHSDDYDLARIRLAYDEAKLAHEGQQRLTGEPFFIHPLNVACIVISLGMDTDTVLAALLHDAVEDTDMTTDNIRRLFGDTVANLVEGVTKLNKMANCNREQEQAENVRKMLLAMDEDIRVIIIKLADRLHNMRTLEAQSHQKQLEKSLETLEIYAPIAHRLGIRAVKEELEDLSIRYLDPIAYEEIAQRLEQDRAHHTDVIETIQARIRERLGDSISGLSIEGRVKSIHGIYRKMFMQGKEFEEIYDIYAVRIIVNTVNDCYNVLGLIHEMFRPIPGRFKDYISTPKANMYKSLHTTVIGREGAPFEVQIRTWDMHHTAEYGIAAHWKYKDGLSATDGRFEERLAWIRQLLESQKDVDDVEEIVRTIKTDLAPEDIFGVTPKGDVISLPVGSTMVDFAYAIHSAVGNRMVGAKVDGRIVPLDTKVNTGDVIEIITTSQEGHGPSRDWLKIVRTSEARNKIRAWFKKERRAENIETGRDEIERGLRQARIRLTDEEFDALMQDLADKNHCQTVEDFYAKIGYGGASFENMIPSIRERFRPKPTVEPETVTPTPSASSGDGVVVEGLDNCLIKLSRCCSPLPGDSIIGFITRGHGVSVHKRDCTNVPRDLAHCEEPGRWISAHWADVQRTSFSATIQVLSFDREGLLADITTTISNMRVMIHGIQAHLLRDGNYAIELTILVEGAEHLKSIINKISAINGVYSVERTVG